MEREFVKAPGDVLTPPEAREPYEVVVPYSKNKLTLEAVPTESRFPFNVTSEGLDVDASVVTLIDGAAEAWKNAGAVIRPMERRTEAMKRFFFIRLSRRNGKCSRCGKRSGAQACRVVCGLSTQHSAKRDAAEGNGRAVRGRPSKERAASADKSVRSSRE